MKKIKHLELLPIILISFIAYRFINEKFLISNLLSYILNMCAPFFWAIAIGYVVNIAMKSFEKRFHFKRWLSLTLSYLVVFSVLALFFFVVIPRLISTVPDLISDSTTYAKDFEIWYKKHIAGDFVKYSSQYGIDVNGVITQKTQEVLQFIPEILQGLISGLGQMVVSVTTGLIEFFVGLVVSVYVLLEKEEFSFNSKKLFTAYCGEKFTRKLVKVLKDTDEIFGNYLVAKSLDSFIVGVIAIIGLKLLGLQYAFLFGIIIGVTNMIPYFGPIIGMVPVALITVFISPMQALWAVIFILVLQQVDGNIIGPKLVDGKVGLPALWGVVSVTIGGTLFGFLGMLLGTPVFAVFRKIVLDVQDKKLEQKGLDKNFVVEVEDK